jgi:hypothetical protein
LQLLKKEKQNQKREYKRPDAKTPNLFMFTYNGEMLNKKLTAKNDVSFHIALSRLLFALLPRNMGSVRSLSTRFVSSNTLLDPDVSVL